MNVMKNRGPGELHRGKKKKNPLEVDETSKVRAAFSGTLNGPHGPLSFKSPILSDFVPPSELEGNSAFYCNNYNKCASIKSPILVTDYCNLRQSPPRIKNLSIYTPWSDMNKDLPLTIVTYSMLYVSQLEYSRLVAIRVMCQWKAD